MVIKYQVKWILDGSYRVDVIEAEDSETALKGVVKKICTAKSYRVISVIRMDDSVTENDDGYERARISA